MAGRRGARRDQPRDLPAGAFDAQAERDRVDERRHPVRGRRCRASRQAAPGRHDDHLREQSPGGGLGRRCARSATAWPRSPRRRPTTASRSRRTSSSGSSARSTMCASTGSRSARSRPSSTTTTSSLPADARSNPPVVSASAGVVTQATGIPGSATIVVTADDGVAQTYTVHFARPAVGDEFDGGAPGPQWHMGPAHRRTAAPARPAGALRITTEPGDLLSTPTTTTNTAKNLLVQPAGGDWTIESKLDLGARAARAANQSAGIIAYQGDDDYLRFGIEYGGTPAGVQLSVTSEDSRSCCATGYAQAGGRCRRRSRRRGRRASAAATRSLWLRMQKSGCPLPHVVLGRRGLRSRPVYETGAPLDGRPGRPVRVQPRRHRRAAGRLRLSPGRRADADAAGVPAGATEAPGTVGGDVPPTLSLTLGAPATFGAFTPGVAKDYTASTTANVVSHGGRRDAVRRRRRRRTSTNGDVLAALAAAGHLLEVGLDRPGLQRRRGRSASRSTSTRTSRSARAHTPRR